MSNRGIMTNGLLHNKSGCAEYLTQMMHVLVNWMLQSFEDKTKIWLKRREKCIFDSIDQEQLNIKYYYYYFFLVSSSYRRKRETTFFFSISITHW